MACKILKQECFYSPQNITNKHIPKPLQNFQDYCVNSKNKANSNLDSSKIYRIKNQLQRALSYQSQSDDENNRIQKKMLESNVIQQCKTTFQICLNENIQHQQNNINQQNNEQQLKLQIFSSPQSYDSQDQSRKKLFVKKEYLNQVYTNDQNSTENDDREEEFSIWDNSDLQCLGVNTEQFVDARGTKLKFYQMYRLRQALYYKPQYISRIDTIKSVQSISTHYNQEIPINEMKQQQTYLDQHFDIQRKDFNENKKNHEEWLKKCPKKQMHNQSKIINQSKVFPYRKKV